MDVSGVVTITGITLLKRRVRRAVERIAQRRRPEGSILSSQHRTPMPAATVAARPSAARRRPLRPARVRE
jgi:hypothetical protein